MAKKNKHIETLWPLLMCIIFKIHTVTQFLEVLISEGNSNIFQVFVSAKCVRNSKYLLIFYYQVSHKAGDYTSMWPTPYISDAPVNGEQNLKFFKFLPCGSFHNYPLTTRWFPLAWVHLRLQSLNRLSSTKDYGFYFRLNITPQLPQRLTLNRDWDEWMDQVRWRKELDIC